MSPEIAKQAIESVTAIKDSAPAIAGTIAYTGAGVVAVAPAVDYSSPVVFIPLGVAILAGIYHAILIHDKLKK